MQGKTKLIPLSVLLISVVFLTGCSALSRGPDIPIRDVGVNFFTIVKSTSDGEVQIDIGVSAVSPNPVPTDDAFDGLWELRTSGGDLRSAGEIAQLPELTGETWLASWQGVLEPGSYELMWGAPNYGGTLKVFEVLARDGRLEIGDQHEYYTTAYPPEEW